MDLRSALAKLCEIEEQISIDNPPTRIAKSYLSFMPGNRAPELPCVTHQWTFPTERRMPNNQREQRFSIRGTVIIGTSGADADVKADIATAFLGAFVAAFDKGIKFEDGSFYQHIGGDGAYFPEIYARGGIDYVGFEYLMELVINDVALFGF